jgi:hypothetical protein
MKYEDMSYTNFIENVLGIKLSDEQKTMLEIFEENKSRRYPTYELQEARLPKKVTCSIYSSKDTVSVEELFNELRKRTKLLGM